MGCALAYQLAKRDVDVLLLERAELGSQSTGKCAGGVRQQFSNEPNVHMMMLARRLFESFEEETGGHADFRQIGYLFVLSRPQDVETLQAQMEMWHRAGLADARWVDAAEAARLSPVLNTEDVLGCTFCPSDGIASPADVTAGYAAAARRHGARIREGLAIDAIEVSGGRVSGVRTPAGEISTRAVFVCAGAWSPALGRTAGVEIPVLPYRRHIFVTDTFPEVSRSNPMTVDFASSLYFHPEGDGVLVGMSDRSEPPGFNEEVNWDFVEKMVEEASRRAPALQRAGLKTAWAGLYETTPDHQAILGPVPEVPGLWCGCGFSGHGFMQAPAAALLLAQLLLEGRSELDLEPFSYGRFARGQLVAEQNVI